MKKIIFSAFLAVVIMSGTLLFDTGDSAEAEGTEYKYEVLDESAKTARITHILHPQSTVVIPATIDGYQIVEVGTMTEEYEEVQQSDGIILKKPIGEVIDSSEKNNVSEIVFPKGLQSIGVAAFNHCEKLANITLPDSLKNIGKYAFTNCLGIKNVTIGKNMELVGESAFSYCMSLEKVEIQSDKVTIGETAFANMVGNTNKNKLREVILPQVFYGQLKEGCFATYCGKNFVWPEFRGKEENNKFLNFALNLKNITFPRNIKNVYIGMEIYNKKAPIQQLIIPEGVKQFKMEQQKKLLKQIIIKDKNTQMIKGYSMGIKNRNYICAKTIIAAKGSKAEKFAKKCYYPDIDNISNDWSDGNDYFTELNIGMKKVKFIGVTLPAKPATKVKGKKIYWKKQKGVKQYEVYYSKKKKGTYQKLAVTKKTSYRTKKKGYMKVQAVKMKYGTNWKSDFSKVNRIS